MYHSRTNLVIPLVVGVVFAWAYGGCVYCAQNRPDAEVPDATTHEQQKHGLPEILSQQLFRDRKIELLLRSAESVRDSRDAERLRESLLPIFAYPHDVLEYSAADESVHSLRARALTLLMHSTPELQRTWVDSNRVIAEQELESAVRRGGRLGVAGVARRYPLTEAGIRAEVIRLTCELLKRDSRTVAIQVRQLEETYKGTVLQSELQRQLRSLKDILETPEAGDESAHSIRLSIPASTPDGTIAPPWPEPLWTWRESIWSFPGAPQGEAGGLLSKSDPEAPNRLDDFNNWRPVFWNDSVVVRTPFRIVALDRSTGQEYWSVPTDTFRRQPAFTYDELAAGQRQAMNESQSLFEKAAQIYGLAEYGLLSVNDDFLFFIDHFTFFAGRDPFVDNTVGRVIRNRNGFPVIEEVDELSRDPVASRLVALRDVPGDVPVVAWQIGDAQQYPYDPVARVEFRELTATAVDSDRSVSATHAGSNSGNGTENLDDPWSGHRFLSPPTGLGTQLFVLTLNETQIFLNCLQRNTGNLLWRQPLAYTDENALSLIDMSIFTKRTSTCVVSGETIVCSLADGMLIGVRAADGTLMWATAIRDATSVTPQFRFGRAFPQDEASIASPSILVPCISDGIIVCCSHYSESVCGLSLQTGEILWKSYRRAFGAGEVGGSPDYYVAGICGTQVILIGDRHCRSLDLQSGDQNWVVEIRDTSGRAECRGDRCVIPMRSGQAVTVNLLTGTLIPQSILDFPQNLVDQFGAVAGDDELICVSTPTVVAGFQRVDVLLKEADRRPTLTVNPEEQVLVQAQAHLINGDFDTSLALLRDSVTSHVRDDTSIPRVEEYLAQLVLEQWGQAIESRGESITGQTQGAEQYTLPAESLPPDAALLSQLELAPDLRFRANICQLLSDYNSDRQSPVTLRELRQQRRWSSPVRLTSQWSVRPDLLFDETSPDRPVDPRTFDALSVEELRQLVHLFLQHPDVIPDATTRQDLAAQLIGRGAIAAAELFLIRWYEASLTTDSTSSGLASGMLSQMRSATETSGSLAPGAGVTSAVSEPLTFELLPFIRRPDADFEAWDRQLWSDSVPKRCRMHTYLSSGPGLSDESETIAKLITVDPFDGSVRDEVTLPFLIDRAAARFVPPADGDLTPSLFPVFGAGEIAMISTPLPGKASVLWRRSLQSGEPNMQRVEFGSLGSEHFIWQFADELHCSDPLTGKDLWTRRLTLSQSDEAVLHRGRNPSVRRIAGDRQVTIVMGSDSQSYERFHTRDGRQLAAGRLNIDRSVAVLTVGRCLLYTGFDRRLHLFDSATGRDQLADAEPIMPVHRDHRMVCQDLENNRVLFVAESQELLQLILIDVEHGTVVFRTPVSDFVRQDFVFGFSAFERNGRLFAALSGGGRSVRSIQQAFIRGAPHVSNGPLLCLDPVTGDVRWSVNVEEAIFPDIHGDPADLLVSWSAPKQTLDGNIGSRSEDKLVIQVFDETTGQLIAQSPTLSSLPPLRCVHIGSESLIELTTPNATISIRAPPVALQ